MQSRPVAFHFMLDVEGSVLG